MAAVTKKEKKERKFNSERTARQVKNALKAIFPNEAMEATTIKVPVGKIISSTDRANRF